VRERERERERERKRERDRVLERDREREDKEALFTCLNNDAFARRLNLSAFLKSKFAIRM
jgi:hypothetical protein